MANAGTAWPGATLRIARGMRSDSAEATRCRCILTPRGPGRGSFREMAVLVPVAG